ncbi:hypothetical protein RJ640_019284 [Escallonia rubra]|uniref:PPM-type phosphatase domain-containing protein n=1 Tax=Escallonia rubra TaxID=112253 RepID=A0AA88UQG7_9ASTE|nr:hypothetical protein RJ640_019284 [Escallonia rubra]
MFQKLENRLENIAKQDAIREAYLKTDKEFLKLGGYVELHRGPWRVHGVLSVSRSIGDAHLKDWVLAEPDTRILALTPDMEYLILASDGLWEEVRNEIALLKCLLNETLVIADILDIVLFGN